MSTTISPSTTMVSPSCPPPDEVRQLTTVPFEPPAQDSALDTFDHVGTALYGAASAVPLMGTAINGTQMLLGLNHVSPGSTGNARYGAPATLATLLNLAGAGIMGAFDGAMTLSVPAGLCLASAAVLGAVAAHNSARARCGLLDVDPSAAPSSPPRGLHTATYTTVAAALSAVPVLGAAVNVAQMFRGGTRGEWGTQAFAAFASNVAATAFIASAGQAVPAAICMATAGVLGGIAAYNAFRSRAGLVGN